VVKCGSDGSIIQQKGNQYGIEPETSRAVDTTGAGDLYAAGFFYGLMNGYPLDMCGKLGSILGGKVVEIIGARMSEKKWEEINTFIHNILRKMGP
jgi:sugar/nucleoside kinase (ribokinase family)